MPELIALPDVRIVPTAERYVEGFNRALGIERVELEVRKAGNRAPARSTAFTTTMRSWLGFSTVNGRYRIAPTLSNLCVFCAASRR